VVDINDRFLRGVTVGEGPQEQQFARKTGYDITVASEIMAILVCRRTLPLIVSMLSFHVCVWVTEPCVFAAGADNGFGGHEAEVREDDFRQQSGMCALRLAFSDLR
jgi:hypothetical protein